MAPASHSAVNTAEDSDEELLEFDIGDSEELPEIPVADSQNRTLPPTNSPRHTPDPYHEKPLPTPDDSSISSAITREHTNTSTATVTEKPESLDLPPLSNDLSYTTLHDTPPSLEQLAISTSPRQEHINRLKRKDHLDKYGHTTPEAPLGRLGFNHNQLDSIDSAASAETGHSRGLSSGSYGLTNTANPITEEKEAPLLSDDEDWQQMQTIASYEVYDEKGRKIVVRQADFETQRQTDDKQDMETGGSKYGYTRVTIDEDVKSVTSMDENTDFLFDEDDFKRNPLSQLENTKHMLTEGQRIAYVGLCKLAMIELATELAQVRASRKIAKRLSTAQGAMAKWAQMMMMRLYSHMDISSDGKKV